MGNPGRINTILLEEYRAKKIDLGGLKESVHNTQPHCPFGNNRPKHTRKPEQQESIDQQWLKGELNILPVFYYIPNLM